MKATSANAIEQIIFWKDIPIRLLRKHMRSLRLSIQPGGNVRLSVPLHLADKEWQTFLEKKEVWLRTHLQQQATRPQNQPINRCTCLFLGRERALKYEPGTIGHRIFTGDDEAIHIQGPEIESDELFVKILDFWYKKQLQPLVSSQIPYWENRMQVRVQKLRFRRMKTRWGTCKWTEGVITLNTELAKYPLECIEYVLIHEMVHLLERGHGAPFKKCMDQFLPDWRTRKKRLQTGI